MILYEYHFEFPKNEVPMFQAWLWLTYIMFFLHISLKWWKSKGTPSNATVSQEIRPAIKGLLRDNGG